MPVFVRCSLISPLCRYRLTDNARLTSHAAQVLNSLRLCGKGNILATRLETIPLIANLVLWNILAPFRSCKAGGYLLNLLYRDCPAVLHLLISEASGLLDLLHEVRSV